jgi:hypothetical protein
VKNLVTMQYSMFNFTNLFLFMGFARISALNSAIFITLADAIEGLPAVDSPEKPL